MPDFATRPARPLTVSAAPATGRWLAALHRALDVLVAFATLRDAETAGEAAGLEEPGEARARRPRPIADETTAGTGFAGTAAPPADASHPHRRPLRSPARAGRPGAVRAAPQPCTTPLAVTRPTRRPDRTVEYRH